ncbi:2-dehydropantoate 2-reductase [Halanaeroarchaeum sulfurireducens]|uniref:2-dehydropantoate 2-reductase n=1 Tax=Halanaeroarchaeum sulfurireducens TaxID=1604004 RepID=A0A0N9N509_9EURY|nr:2-dehydropantoate 2-reductase [Halanaeroarchaeum sulfurireducens]ALG82170.1 2-dehydropantoate 2-reductase [Halanaeroarchaeum sulfurireducens]
MQFAIYGAGGVGGYLGARLADAGHDVTLIARGDHLAALQSEGLRVDSVAGDTSVDVPATDDPASVGPVDYVVFTVKAYDTHDAAADLDPLVGPETTVLSFQNGVDNERWLAEEVGESHVAGGVAYIFSTIASPGVVEHTGGPARFVFGELDGSRTDRIETLYEALSGCDGVAAERADDVRVELWRKFAFICAQSGVTAAARLPIGRVRETQPTWEMYRRIIEEVVTVARAKEIELSTETVSEWLEFAEDLDPDMTSSLYYDLEHGNQLELDALNGAVVRHGEETGIDVPMNEAVHAILRPWADDRD